MICRMFCLALCVSLITACGHTIIAGDGSVSPNNALEVQIQGHGKSGRSYEEVTTKKVGIAIGYPRAPRGSDKFRVWAILEAGNLWWECTWSDNDTVRVRFYDHVEGRVIAERGFVVLRRGSLGGSFVVEEKSPNIAMSPKVYLF